MKRCIRGNFTLSFLGSALQLNFSALPAAPATDTTHPILAAAHDDALKHIPYRSPSRNQPKKPKLLERWKVMGKIFHILIPS